MNKVSAKTAKLNANAQLLADNAKRCAEAAFDAGESEARLGERILAACTATPSLEVYDRIRHSVICGLMASALARKGDNRKSAEIISHCDLRLTKYQGFGGLAPVKDGMLGRRTEDEEKAYGSARVRWHNISKAVGVVVPDGKAGGSNNANGASGKAGNTKNTGKVGGATTPKAEPEVAAKGKVSDVIPTPKFASEKQAIAWAKRESAAMLATINGSAGKVPSWLKSAVADFHTAVKKQTAAETVVTAK